MNKRGYSEWKRSADSLAKCLTGPMPQMIDPPYGWVIAHSSPKWNRGDLLNHVNATMDSLVRLRVIQDDSPRWVNRVFTTFDRGAVGIRVYICQTQDELKEMLCELA